MFHYEKDITEYRLVDDNGDILSASAEIAIAYSDSESCGVVMHKHGSPENVDKWVENAVKKYVAAGLNDMADELKVVKSSEWDVEDLNRVLDTTGYLEVLLVRIGVPCQRLGAL